MNVFELNVLYWIQEVFACPFLDWLMPPLSALSAHGEIWILLALVLAAAIGFSRLYLFVHYPTDVVAGALLGVVLAFAARWLVTKIYAKKNAVQ